jgi:site-specific DNA recombinase
VILDDERVQRLVRQPLELATMAALDVQVHQVADFHARCEALAEQFEARRSLALLAVVTRVQVGDATVTLTCDTAALAKALGTEHRSDAPSTIEIGCAARLTRSGRALRLVQDGGATAKATPDRSLIRVLVQARRWWGMLRGGEISTSELAVREGVTNSYVARVLRLAFLAPAVTEAILAGRQRAGVTVASLTAEGAVAADWQTQIATLLPARGR